MPARPENTGPEDGAARTREHEAPAASADRSVWLIWGGVMLAAIATLPFAARSQDVVRAIATMCGFTVG